MLIYLSIALLLFVLAMLRVVGAVDRKYENPIVLLLTITAYIFSFIRWETGTDWQSYVDMFGSLTSVANARAQGWWGGGYSYTAVLMNHYRIGFTGFLACLGLVLFTAKYYALVRTCAAPLVAVFILFCGDFYDVFFLRESVAAIFFWLFAYFFYTKQMTQALLYGLIAVGFHSSAALAIAVVAMVGRPNWRLYIAGSLVFAVGAYALLTRFDTSDLLKLAGLASYVGTDFVEVKDSAVSTAFRAYVKLAYWLVVIVGGYAILLRHRAATEEKTGNLDWPNFALRCGAGIIAATAVLVPVSQVFARLPTYSLPLFAVVLAGYQPRIRRLRAADLAYFLLLVAMFVQLAFLYSGYADLYYPFKTIL